VGPEAEVELCVRGHKLTSGPGGNVPVVHGPLFCELGLCPRSTWTESTGRGSGGGVPAGGACSSEGSPTVAWSGIS